MNNQSKISILTDRIVSTNILQISFTHKYFNISITFKETSEKRIKEFKESIEIEYKDKLSLETIAYKTLLLYEKYREKFKNIPTLIDYISEINTSKHITNIFNNTINIFNSLIETHKKDIDIHFLLQINKLESLLINPATAVTQKIQTTSIHNVNINLLSPFTKKIKNTHIQKLQKNIDELKNIIDAIPYIKLGKIEINEIPITKEYLELYQIKESEIEDTISNKKEEIIKTMSKKIIEVAQKNNYKNVYLSHILKIISDIEKYKEKITQKNIKHISEDIEII